MLHKFQIKEKLVFIYQCKNSWIFPNKKNNNKKRNNSELLDIQGNMQARNLTI